MPSQQPNPLACRSDLRPPREELRLCEPGARGDRQARLTCTETDVSISNSHYEGIGPTACCRSGSKPRAMLRNLCRHKVSSRAGHCHLSPCAAAGSDSFSRLYMQLSRTPKLRGHHSGVLQPEAGVHATRRAQRGVVCPPRLHLEHGLQAQHGRSPVLRLRVGRAACGADGILTRGRRSLRGC